jgi:hypothetical protein
MMMRQLYEKHMGVIDLTKPLDDILSLMHEK